MSDKITTLHLKNDPSTNIYPNVKMENIPLDAAITRDGENLVKTKTIYDFAHLNFLSLDGGTMDGIITINDIGTPEKTILGDGVEVVEVSNPANPATHYGCGYIRQDDDENTSVKYEYNFPKKSGTFALEEELEELKSLVYSLHSLTYNSYEFPYLTSSTIPEEVDGRKTVGGSYAIADWVGGNSVVTDDEIKSTIISKIESWGYNLFDGEWEQGRYDLNTGLPVVGYAGYYRSKNKIKVVGGKTYTISRTENTLGYLYEYDKDNNFLGNTYIPTGTTNDFVLKQKTAYISISLGSSLTSEPTNTCVHLTGSRTGYAPYVGKLGQINIPNAPLKLDGVNDIHNTLTFEKQSDGSYNAIRTKKFDIVDLGVQNWASASYGFYITLNNAKSVGSLNEKGNILCTKYPTETSQNLNFGGYDKTIAIDQNNHIQVRDSSFTDVASFKSAMSGVHLLFELATPTTEVIATGLTFDKVSFPIEKGGTIKAVYEEVPPTISVNFMTKGE